MVAARLLVESGCPPQDAINRVRAARPGAIEHPGAERYVLSHVPQIRTDEEAQLSLLPGRVQ
jgi:protein-tyrosine phosphatase